MTEESSITFTVPSVPPKSGEQLSTDANQESVTDVAPVQTAVEGVKEALTEPVGNGVEIPTIVEPDQVSDETAPVEERVKPAAADEPAVAESAPAAEAATEDKEKIPAAQEATEPEAKKDATGSGEQSEEEDTASPKADEPAAAVVDVDEETHDKKRKADGDDSEEPAKKKGAIDGEEDEATE